MWQYVTDQIIMPLALAAVTAIVAWIAATIAKYTGINLEAKHREALHSALMTGVRMALERLGPNASIGAIQKEALAYVERSVPDALNKFSPPVQVLEGLVEAKLQEVKAPLQAALMTAKGS